MVTHHPPPVQGNDDAEVLLGRCVAREEVRLLAQRHAVDGDVALLVAAGHMVAGNPDDPLDVVMHARRGAEQPGDRVPEPAGQRRGLRRDRVPGAVAVEHDDVAAMDRPEVVDELVDQHLVADFQRVLHRRRRNVERLDHEALDEQGQDQREDQQDGQFHPPRHVRPPLALGPSVPWLGRVAARPARPGIHASARGAAITRPAADHPGRRHARTSHAGPVQPGTRHPRPGHPGPGRAVTVGPAAVCPAVAESPAGTTWPRRPGRAVEPQPGTCGTATTGLAVARHTAELLTIDLAWRGMPVTCGQFLAPSVPVVIHRFEPSAGYPQRRCPRSRAGMFARVAGAAFPLVSGSTRPLPRGRLAALPDPGTLAAQRPEVVQLGPAHPAPADDLDLVDRRAVHRKGPLHSHAVADLADGERLPGPAALAPDHHALEDLDPGPVALNDPDVNLQRVPRPEPRDVGANLRLFQVGNGGVHGWRSSVVLAHAPVRHDAMRGYGLSWSLSAKSIPAR